MTASAPATPATPASPTASSSSIEAFVEEASAFLDEHATRRPTGTGRVVWGEGEDRISYFGDEPPEVDRAKVDAARAWQRTRHEHGFGWITGPTEYGGRALSPLHDLVYDQLEAGYDVPDTGVISLIGLGMIGPTILAHAREEIKQRYLPAMFRGDAIACQLFSEPGAGSDLANVATRAVRDGEEWVLNGQKVWTSVAHHAELGMAVCRSDPSQPKHRGITAFLVDMSLPGVEVRPLRQMTGGAEFNEVFLTDVRVPDDHRLGEVDDGWRVTMTTLMSERASVGGEGAGPVERAVSRSYLTAMLEAMGLSRDAAARRRLAEVLADLTATGYLNQQSLRTLLDGRAPGPEASASKLMFSHNLAAASHLAAEMVGPRMIAETGDWGTFSWNELLLGTPALRILGGTEEIMKNIIGERVLGLPKEPGTDTKAPFRAPTGEQS
ncbi:acyl-CoA dehydrogenase family protein [Nocardioides sp. SOB44]|uniref:Acyl-CoA dehydrogenase family protein n=1 Tax=Nocardioides cremeus TaxID=3058044 RepID=A0ABT8TN55_9ACTN|nr:acyl-CoA dehydrogenase family protein [Nocardioides cremeus]MDO3395394.1 acyl-CoA dehydrogenase family protein [Nocardioides cremeus]